MKYQVIRATTRPRSLPSRIDERHLVVREGSWEECERFMVHLHESKVGNLENRWAGRDMLVRIGSTGKFFIVYRIVPKED